VCGMLGTSSVGTAAVSELLCVVDLKMFCRDIVMRGSAATAVFRSTVRVWDMIATDGVRTVCVLIDAPHIESEWLSVSRTACRGTAGSDCGLSSNLVWPEWILRLLVLGLVVVGAHSPGFLRS
jgi:hypothetical protein